MNGLIQRTVLLALMASVLFQATGSASVVFCHSEGDVTIELALSGKCVPAGSEPSQGATLSADSSCGPCVDLPLAKIFLSRSSSPSPPAVVILAAGGLAAHAVPDTIHLSSNNAFVSVSSASPLSILRSSILLI